MMINVALVSSSQQRAHFPQLTAESSINAFCPSSMKKSKRFDSSSYSIGFFQHMFLKRLKSLSIVDGIY